MLEVMKARWKKDEPCVVRRHVNNKISTGYVK